jgi:D-3-phosphoglycerate dehydrogenase
MSEKKVADRWLYTIDNSIFDMSEYTVVVTDHDFGNLSIEKSILEDIAVVHDCSRDVGAEIDTTDLDKADAVLNLRTPLSAEHIAQLENCRVIARYGIGVDNVDVSAAADMDIPVTNVTNYCIEEVATHALALALNLLRGVKRYNASVAAGEWNRDTVETLRRVSELTVGIVGYGSIGQAVGQRVASLDATVVASDPFLEPANVSDDPATLVEFEELLSRADIVTIHSPLTDDTRDLFDREVFERMQEGAFLVNVARGPIVQMDALQEALATNVLAGAALDVFPEEPPAANHPLRDHPRVITTPHIAWYSEEANDERRQTAAEIVRAALMDDMIPNIVNEVSP